MCFQTISDLCCIRSQQIRGTQITGTIFPRQLNFVWLCLIFIVPLFQYFYLTFKNVFQFTCIKQKAPDNSKVHSSQCGSCFMSPFWQLKFGGDSRVFGKFVNHVVTSLRYLTLYIGKLPI